jgi:hypothetical protein
MGTGIVAVLLISIPFKAQWLYYLSIVFFILNSVLFALALATSMLRYSLYPEIWTVMIQDPINSLFLATMPMGLATLIEMWVFVCVPLWGPWARTFAWALWMVDSVIAVAVTVFLSFLLSVPIHSDRDDDSQADDSRTVSLAIISGRWTRSPPRSSSPLPPLLLRLERARKLQRFYRTTNVRWGH